MATGHYLLDHPNPHGDHFHSMRREPILAIVEHITAGLQDLDFVGPDHSAERTAAYAASTERAVSWHEGTDTDGTLSLLPDKAVAFHVRGFNSCTLGREISKAHTDWTVMTPRWVNATLGHAARADARWCQLHNIPIRKASRGELVRARDRWRATGLVYPVGFLSHAELDPERRTDPGFVRGRDTFPWAAYLHLVRLHLNPPSEEDDVTKALAMFRIEYLYRSVGRNPHDPKEAGGLLHWNTQLDARDPDTVVKECEALLYLAATKAA